MDFDEKIIELKTSKTEFELNEDQKMMEMDFPIEIEDPRQTVKHLVDNIISTLFVDKNEDRFDESTTIDVKEESDFGFIDDVIESVLESVIKIGKSETINSNESGEERTDKILESVLSKGKQNEAKNCSKDESTFLSPQKDFEAIIDVVNSRTDEVLFDIVLKAPQADVMNVDEESDSKPEDEGANGILNASDSFIMTKVVHQKFILEIEEESAKTDVIQEFDRGLIVSRIVSDIIDDILGCVVVQSIESANENVIGLQQERNSSDLKLKATDEVKLESRLLSDSGLVRAETETETIDQSIQEEISMKQETGNAIFTFPQSRDLQQQEVRASGVPANVIIKKNFMKKNPSEELSCKLCSTMFERKSILLKHIRLDHQHKNRFFCAHCNMGFREMGQLHQHKKSVHNISEKRFASKSKPISDGTDQRVQTRNNNKRKSGELLESDAEVKKPRAEESQSGLQNCVTRGSKRKSLEIVKETEMKKPKSGNVVNVEKKKKKEISKEKQTTFTCNRCNKTFGLKVNLKRHLQTHQTTTDAEIEKEKGETVKEEESNKKDFPSKNHTERSQAKFVCQLCSKPFLNENSLNRHKRLIHNEKMACPKCPRKFTKQDSLDKHLEDNHKTAKTGKKVPIVIRFSKLKSGTEKKTTSKESNRQSGKNVQIFSKLQLTIQLDRDEVPRYLLRNQSISESKEESANRNIDLLTPKMNSKMPTDNKKADGIAHSTPVTIGKQMTVIPFINQQTKKLLSPIKDRKKIGGVSTRPRRVQLQRNVQAAKGKVDRVKCPKCHLFHSGTKDLIRHMKTGH